MILGVQTDVFCIKENLTVESGLKTFSRKDRKDYTQRTQNK